MASPKESATREWVYGVGQGICYGLLILLPREIAEAQARLWDVLTSTTWGEMRAKATPDELAEILIGVDEDMAAPPDDQAPFDYLKLPTVEDGYFPTDPRCLMDDLLREDLFPDEVSALGHGESPDIGTFFVIEAEQRDQVLAAMGQLGYRCVEETDLIWRIEPR